MTWANQAMEHALVIACCACRASSTYSASLPCFAVLPVASQLFDVCRVVINDRRLLRERSFQAAWSKKRKESTGWTNSTILPKSKGKPVAAADY